MSHNRQQVVESRVEKLTCKERSEDWSREAMFLRLDSPKTGINVDWVQIFLNRQEKEPGLSPQTIQNSTNNSGLLGLDNPPAADNSIIHSGSCAELGGTHASSDHRILDDLS